MKLSHFLIIIIPVAISIIAIAVYTVPYVLPVQPLSVIITGYHPYTCNNSSNVCMSSSPILFGNNSNVFHKRDRFLFVVSVTNPNFFPIHFDSASTTFDRNAINYHYSGCAGGVVEIGVMALESTEITIPNSSCDIYIANSEGESNATVSLQYKINGIQYSANASKTFTILPKT